MNLTGQIFVDNLLCDNSPKPVALGNVLHHFRKVTERVEGTLTLKAVWTLYVLAV